MCSFSAWVALNSESYKSTDGTTIYSMFTYGNTATICYLYFVSQSVASGSVMATRYKSSTTVRYVYGGIFNGDYIVSFYLIYYEKFKAKIIIYLDSSLSAYFENKQHFIFKFIFYKFEN